MCHLFYSSIDRSCPIFGPVRPPFLGHHVRVQKSFLLVKECELSSRSGVIALRRDTLDVIDERIGHAQGGNEIVNATVLPGEYTEGLIVVTLSAEATNLMAVLDKINERWAGERCDLQACPLAPIGQCDGDDEPEIHYST